MRAFLSRRFPSLAEASIVETRVCQYENTSNGDFLIDRHPDTDRIWLAGGGSGHGYKLGPVLGEFVARHALGKRAETILDEMRIGASEWPADTERPNTTSL